MCKLSNFLSVGEIKGSQYQTSKKCSREIFLKSVYIEALACIKERGPRISKQKPIRQKAKSAPPLTLNEIQYMPHEQGHQEIDPQILTPCSRKERQNTHPLLSTLYTIIYIYIYQFLIVASLYTTSIGP
ncbi:hypothetical protein CIPAW_07G179400 [Carya illinoinensis]|uniref:Uncharacterized protein n=1 Tax=Carya illinoinensis TaxID=32201 RepID=A0A8T1Q2U2_CARIL|nr:hypothetical protein CIPAW_07G179400 [Carya illinoinensis]